MDYTEIIKEMIKPELLILIPVLYFIGVAIRESEKIKNEYIPILIGIIGVAIAMVYVLATEPIGTGQGILLAVFTAITQGVLVAGVSVYINQIIKQKKYLEEETEKTGTDTEIKKTDAGESGTENTE